MSFVARIGDTVQTLAEATIEWKVRDFFSLSDKVDDHYQSPLFGFADSLWCLELYPNGERFDGQVGWVSIYIVREDSGPPKDIKCTLGYKCSDGVEKGIIEEDAKLSKDDGLCGDDFWTRAELREQASRIMPDDVLTITCHLKCSEPNNEKVSWISRVWEVSRNMKSLLSDEKRADFTLKLGERDWPVHKVILESRSEYFANMFRHDWVENTVGEVTFEDMEADALGNVLNFIYSGDVEDMTVDNVCEIYLAAHKFLMDGLRTLCVEHMKGNMCEEIFYKALVIADTYGEEDVRQSAIEFFMEEDDQIFDSEEWKKFKKDRPSIAADLLEETTKREKKKRTNESLVSS